MFGAVPCGCRPGGAWSQAQAQASGEPIKIGYGMALTGGLAANGKSALLAQKIWEEDVNAKGGLLGRPVKLVYYDDQSNPVDRAGHLHQAARRRQGRPDHRRLRHQHAGAGDADRDAEEEDVHRPVRPRGQPEFNYPKYFVDDPVRAGLPKPAFTKGFFDAAMAQNPKPQTVAIVAADEEFSSNASRRRARKRQGGSACKVVYDKQLSAGDHRFHADRARHPGDQSRLVVICSYPPDSVGMVKAVNEIGFKPKMIGGGMVGLQATVVQDPARSAAQRFHQLRLLAAGWPKMDFPGVADFMKKYQARAPARRRRSARLLHRRPGATRSSQVLEQAVGATKSLDDDKLADYIRARPRSRPWSAT